MTYLAFMLIVVALVTAAAAGWDLNNYARAEGRLAWPIWWVLVAVICAAMFATTGVELLYGVEE